MTSSRPLSFSGIRELTQFAGQFLQRRREGFLEGQGFSVPLSSAEQEALKPYAGKEIDLGVRPENVSAGTEGTIPMKVFSNENLGMNTLVHGHIGHSNAAGSKISAKLRGWCNYSEGDEIMISFDRRHFFDKDTGTAIREEANA